MRPQVRLDALAHALDRVLDHPAAAVLGELFPVAGRSVRRLRDNLPEVASGLEARAIEHMKSEAAALERDALEWLRGLAKPKRRRAAPKRMKGKRR
jgi:hypothetical protein